MDVFTPEVAPVDCGSALPPFLLQVDASHSLLAVGGFIACTRCAHVASQTAGRFLTARCAGQHNKGADAALRALVKGKLPAAWERWPDLKEPQRGQRTTRLL